jgi:hypothetical protein
MNADQEFILLHIYSAVAKRRHQVDLKLKEIDSLLDQMYQELKDAADE